jgi:hypothetical protein
VVGKAQNLLKTGKGGAGEKKGAVDSIDALAARSLVSAGISVRVDKPPQRKLMGRRATLQPIVEAAALLGPGQWFEYPSPKPTTVRVMKKVLAAQKLDGVDVYGTPDGRVIVLCRDEEDFIEDET